MTRAAAILAALAALAAIVAWYYRQPAAVPPPLDCDGKPFCPTGYAQRYHAIGECCCEDDDGVPAWDSYQAAVLARR